MTAFINISAPVERSSRLCAPDGVIVQDWPFSFDPPHSNTCIGILICSGCVKSLASNTSSYDIDDGACQSKSNEERLSSLTESKLLFKNDPIATKAHPPTVIINMVLQNTFAVIPSFSSKSSALFRPSFLLLLLFDDEDDDANKLSRSRFEPISFLYRVVICSLLFSLFLSTKKKKGWVVLQWGGSFYWKCARPPFLLPMGVVHRTREKKKNKRAKSVCSLAQKGKSGKKAPLLASVDRCVMCCFQCEVNTHRQKRARAIILKCE